MPRTANPLAGQVRSFARLLAVSGLASVLTGAPARAEEPGPDAPAEAPAPDAPAPAEAPAPDAPAEAPAPAAGEPGRKLVWLVLPNFSYDSDDKLGFGVRGELDVVESNVDPYRSAWVVHLFATTNGYHHHRFKFDLVGLGPKERVRVTGHFAFRAWLNDGYWGIGNGTVRELRYEDLPADDPARERYRYALLQPFGQLALRHQVAGPLLVYGSVNVRYTFIEAEPGSLVDDERPLGYDGGLGVQGIAGALWDTREPEVTPDRGWLLEASGRVVTGTYTFGGPFASVRTWVKLGERVVLGQRVMAEWLFGEVPFYEMVHWGGMVPIAGMGGADSLRGVAFGRWRAPAKAVSNTELRLDVLRHRALQQELRWQLVPFVDLGTVWGAEDPAASVPDIPLHPALGGGVRAIWGETIVGRVDGAVGPDWTDQGDRLDWGLYIVFDHMF